jgi:hypothetical protein
MLDIVARKRREGADYVQFTLHSSEFMPGGSPTFRSPASIESLYRDMEALFSDIAAHFRGSGLTDYARSRAARRQTSASLST